ncbi:MAG: DASH family cryptochrome, partial [Myxococcota bacterium]
DGVALTGFWGSTLFHRDDLPFAPEHVPDVFTKFRRKVEKKSKPRPTLPAPGRLPALESAIDPGEIPSLERLGLVERTVDRRRALAFVGGETAARERMDSWIWQRNCLRQYKKTRNGLIGADYSSKLSPWLSVGAVSARTVAEEIARYEEQRTRNESTYWLLFELLWRDYFHFIAVRYGSRLFQLRGPKGPPDATWRREREEFEAWCEGRTGIPFVDANMRELRLTGFMSNRGRQNVASFLTKNLEIDWRWGASWFESQLVDYDPGSNWGNWAYVAGVGNDPRDRFFHIENQADRYDPEGAYVRTWVPELAPLAGGAIHTAHRLAEHELVRAGVAGHAYPPPILDMDASYRKLRRRAA